MYNKNINYYIIVLYYKKCWKEDFKMLEKLNNFKNDFFPKCEMILDFNGIVSLKQSII